MTFRGVFCDRLQFDRFSNYIWDSHICNLVNTKKVSTADVTLWNGQMKNVNSRTNCENSEQTSIFFGMDNSIYENLSHYLNTVAMKSNQKKK